MAKCVIKKNPKEHVFKVAFEVTKAELDTIRFALGFLESKQSKEIMQVIDIAWQNLGM